MERDSLAAAQFAEVVLHPGYRQAMNDTFEIEGQDVYDKQRSEAEAIVVSVLRVLPRTQEPTWEFRRQAILSELNGVRLGAFNEYFQDQGGNAFPGTLTAEDLGHGRSEVVRTNNQIVGISKVHEDPIDFMDEALEVINAQEKFARGPENYMTALKYFTDKYQNFPSSHLDKDYIIGVVNRCLDGFVDIAHHDRPNFVEMTNLYSAVRGLPGGSFDKQYTKDIIKYSLEQLPTYDNPALVLMIASMSKLDLTGHGEAAGTLMDLALRKTSALERTVNMVQTIRSIANLPACSAAERTFATFLQSRNNLEQPQDIEGLDRINSSLRHIVENVISDPKLSQQAKELAEKCAALSVRIIRRKEYLGDTTPEEIARLKQTVSRIVRNYNSI